MVRLGKVMSREFSQRRMDKRKYVNQVVFLLNTTQIGHRAFTYACKLRTVDIPEGVTIIGQHSFRCCHSLIKVSFPKSLTKIGDAAFSDCTALDDVDLRHTNLRELGTHVFVHCCSLKHLTLPHVPQVGVHVFAYCSSLIPKPNAIDVDDYPNDVTKKVVDYLRSQSEIQAFLGYN